VVVEPEAPSVRCTTATSPGECQSAAVKSELLLARPFQCWLTSLQTHEWRPAQRLVVAEHGSAPTETSKPNAERAPLASTLANKGPPCHSCDGPNGRAKTPTFTAKGDEQRVPQLYTKVQAAVPRARTSR